jgi:rhodanese-related sulfurtransferase
LPNWHGSTGLAAPARLELLELLAQTVRSVEVLAELAGLSVANTSQLLRVLRRSGLVTSRRDGQFVRYRLPGPEPVRLLATLHAVAAHSSPVLARLVDSLRRSTDGMEPISADELASRSDEGLVTVVDVRPPEEFASGHIPRAINIPLGRLSGESARLPPNEVVAYCRGVLCIMSMEAVAHLRTAGLSARRLEFGFPEWRASGRPVASLPPSA